MASHHTHTAKRAVSTYQSSREQEVSRRIEQVSAQLEEARVQAHCAQAAAHAAEMDLLARRLECEAALIHLADLADLLESLQVQTA